jgi:hypothetical protein
MKRPGSADPQNTYYSPQKGKWEVEYEQLD